MYLFTTVHIITITHVFTMTEHTIKDHLEKDNEYIKCKICSYKTKKMYNYNRHMDNVHKKQNILHVKKYGCECSICDFRSEYKNSILRHMENVHMMVKNYNCPYKNDKLEPEQITGQDIRSLIVNLQQD